MHGIHDRHVRALDERRTELEHRVEQYTAAVRGSNAPDPSLGRELDAASSLLAQVRAELARRRRLPDGTR